MKKFDWVNVVTFIFGVIAIAMILIGLAVVVTALLCMKGYQEYCYLHNELKWTFNNMWDFVIVLSIPVALLDCIYKK